MERYDIVVKTFSGLENALFKEAYDLGFTKELEKLNRGIRFRGTLEDVYKANLFLRTALKVLINIASFPVKNERELYEGVKKINWFKYLTLSQTLSVEAIGQSDVINNTHFIALRTKDAIVDVFREKYGQRPDIDRRNADLPIVIYMAHKDAYLYLNTSGEPLFKRGYRQMAGIAPLNELLAAGILLYSQWDKTMPLLDPMCGSGTIPIEAAMIANNIPPNFYRKSFAFQNWRTFDYDLWKQIRNAVTFSKTPQKTMILGYDKQAEMIDVAKTNAENAKVDKYIQFEQHDFFDIDSSIENGMIVFNPPYNKRIKLEDSKQYYQLLGRHLKFKFQGNAVCIFAAKDSGVKFLGLKPDKKIPLFNDNMDGQVLYFNIYKGRRDETK
jgi:putative N6-adenine-specific DNA methylase